VFLRSTVLHEYFLDLLKEANAKGVVRDDENPTGIELMKRLEVGRCDLAPGWIPASCPMSIFHIGSFLELMRTIGPFLDPQVPARCLLWPSKASERYVDGGNLRDLDVNAYGYALFRLANNLLPLVIWPTAVFVAEHILGNRVRMAAAGIHIVEDPEAEIAGIFVSNDTLAAFESLRTNFEAGPR